MSGKIPCDAAPSTTFSGCGADNGRHDCPALSHHQVDWPSARNRLATLSPAAAEVGGWKTMAGATPAATLVASRQNEAGRALRRRPGRHARAPTRASPPE